LATSYDRCVHGNEAEARFGIPVAAGAVMNSHLFSDGSRFCAGSSERMCARSRWKSVCIVVVGISAAGPLKERTDDCGGVIVVLPARAAGNGWWSFSERLGDLRHIGTLLGGEVTQFICTL
jgi:hypothetical protein